MKVVMKKIGLGKCVARIKNKHYVFISVGHPWNECVAYKSDASGNVLDEEPVTYAVGSSCEALARQLVLQA